MLFSSMLKYIIVVIMKLYLVVIVVLLCWMKLIVNDISVSVGSVLLKGIGLVGVISSRVVNISIRLFRCIIFFECIIIVSCIGCESCFMWCIYFSVWLRLVFSLLVVILWCVSFCGIYSGWLCIWFRLISRIEVLNMVFSLGIDIGMMKMVESRIMISSRFLLFSVLSRVLMCIWLLGSLLIICLICWVRGVLLLVLGVWQVMCCKVFQGRVVNGLFCGGGCIGFRSILVNVGKEVNWV